MTEIPESLRKRGITGVRSNLQSGQCASSEIIKAFVFLFRNEIRTNILINHKIQNARNFID